MRHFIVYYSSESNIFNGTVHVAALMPSDAQDKFFRWLREQPVYAHLWNLNFEMKEIKNSI